MEKQAKTRSIAETGRPRGTARGCVVNRAHPNTPRNRQTVWKSHGGHFYVESLPMRDAGGNPGSQRLAAPLRRSWPLPCPPGHLLDRLGNRRSHNVGAVKHGGPCGLRSSWQFADHPGFEILYRFIGAALETRRRFLCRAGLEEFRLRKFKIRRFSTINRSHATDKLNLNVAWRPSRIPVLQQTSRPGPPE